MPIHTGRRDEWIIGLIYSLPYRVSLQSFHCKYSEQRTVFSAHHFPQSPPDVSLSDDQCISNFFCQPICQLRDIMHAPRPPPHLAPARRPSAVDRVACVESGLRLRRFEATDAVVTASSPLASRPLPACLLDQSERIQASTAAR